MSHQSPKGYKAIPGSERKPLTQVSQLGPVDQNARIEVSVYLRPPSGATPLSAHLQQSAQPLSHEDYVNRQSADPHDIEKVVAFAHEHDLTVVSTDPVTRKVVLAGTAAMLGDAFKTDLRSYASPGGTFRGRAGALYVPDELDQVVVGVFGLDDRPQARPRLRIFDPITNVHQEARIFSLPRSTAPTTSYTPLELAQLYEFPPNTDGSGQCIALIELGGGFRKRDLTNYFKQVNLPLPRITSQSVDGGLNHPSSNPNGADGEVDLDIEVAGAVAPGAHIVVYFAPNTTRGFVDAIVQATHDTVNAPSVISISWGSPELDWTGQAMTVMDQAFLAAAALGITVLCAAGDNGSGDGVNDGLAHVDFPASSPHVVGCGGTRLEAANGQITSEVVWNNGPNSATGGGVSDVFALPAWQAGAGVPPSINDSSHVGRGVPDVAGNADPETGYQILVDGQQVVLGGTSAVAPLWAGLIARINQQRGQRVGYLNPILYQHAQQLQNNGLRDITSGNNGGYAAGAGWDACTGLGTPQGVKLLNELSF